MNIVSLNISDLGGLSYNLCDAINKLTPHHAISIVSMRTFTNKPVMVAPVGKGQGPYKKRQFRRKVQNWIRNADVIHLNERARCIAKYGVSPAESRKKKIIYHAHGSIFRRNGPTIIRSYLKAFPHLKIITSTPDLLAFTSKPASWFPSVVPIGKYRKTYSRRRNEPPIIYYSPTGSSTVVMKTVIRQVAAELEKQGLKTRVQMTTKTLHRKNMEMKAKADIYYDEIAPSPFYGVNAIEAGAFEMPVICNMNQYARKYMREHNTKCPFELASNRQQLKAVLRKLIKNRAYRRKAGTACYRYVSRMHRPEICVKRFFSLVQ